MGVVCVVLNNSVHDSSDGSSRSSGTSPCAAAVWAPKAAHPPINAPTMAPAKVPRGVAHGHSIPKVNIPNVLLAAIADNDVATLN